jgi:radical SAM superfamily enzyme YgiQ (UPF0313 family)
VRVLLVYPKFPLTFWSFDKVLELVNRKALLPPLGLLTVAALLPQDWEIRIVDRNAQEVTDEDWAWADMVMLSAMLVQKPDFVHVIRQAKKRGKPVVVGGPFATSVPEVAIAAGADYLVLDEGELTIPQFLECIAGRPHLQRTEFEDPIVFRSHAKPDMTVSPIPRFDLVDFDLYDTMPIQYSRGCPFQCEFCDIITLYGRKPRTKSPDQILAELDRIYELGWRRSVFLVDDNFIGNKRNVKELLRALEQWQIERGFPFTFDTEASIDLAADPELLQMMTRCRFNAVFVGIETPDKETLRITKKYQNTRSPLDDAVETIRQTGMRVMAGFVIGFDGETAGAGERILNFIERTNIPTILFSVLQALPNTELWTRLAREGRLRGESHGMSGTALFNFVPSRPPREIAREYVDTLWQMYDPGRYLDRVFRFFRTLPASRVERRLSSSLAPGWLGLYRAGRDLLINLRALGLVCWRQGFLRSTRTRFWKYLLQMLSHNPRVVEHYLTACAHNEHFLVYREIVRDEIERELAAPDYDDRVAPAFRSLPVITPPVSAADSCAMPESSFASSVTGEREASTAKVVA